MLQLICLFSHVICLVTYLILFLPPTPNVFNFRQLNLHKTQYIFPPNPAITPLLSLQVLGLLQYLLGLPPDILKPLVMQAAQVKGPEEPPLPPAWLHPSA
jgi:hypothetical protein